MHRAHGASLLLLASKWVKHTQTSDPVQANLGFHLLAALCSCAFMHVCVCVIRILNPGSHTEKKPSVKPVLEHPILGQPFFVLHPCKTNEFMTAVLKNPQETNRNVNYITSWLSIVGPVVGLNLPLSYAKATSQDE
ncbi:Atg10 [Phodopus roborovskii]|uniref:Ubiquitin-like-conjugating enzyme ATG10 n=1 Tax=Phodopus roborovskii TaxID=109678 RepID=A0AAU9Z626_PHORO|nr:Atg10 [Phodopus roborovskii]